MLACQLNCIAIWGQGKVGCQLTLILAQSEVAREKLGKPLSLFRWPADIELFPSGITAIIIIIAIVNAIILLTSEALFPNHQMKMNLLEHN